MVPNSVHSLKQSDDRTFQTIGHRLRSGLTTGLGLLCGLGGWMVGDSAVAQTYCRAEIAARIDAIASRPALTQAHIGILVEQQGQTAAERQVIIERNIDKWFVPASTLKLLTTAAALQRLGPNFQIKTSVYAVQQDDKTQLYIVGRGDPTFTTAELNLLVQQIAEQGIRQVDQLWGYDGYFPGQAVHPNWEWEDVLAGYGASANGLILNENAIRLTLYPTEVGQPLRVEWQDAAQASWQINNTSRTVAVGEPLTADIGRDWNQPLLYVFGDLTVDAGPDRFALAVTQPGANFVEQFTTGLTQAGIVVDQAHVTSDWSDAARSEIAAVTSLPLSQWLSRINRNSNNLYTEALLKSLGVTTNNPDDATQAGTELVKEILGGLGVDANNYQMVDGSGLSRHNLVTPQTLVDTLQAMAYNPHGELYRRSLATAAEGDRLNRRYRNAPIPIRLQAKTGFVSNNESLAGYLQPPNHAPLVFSIFLNNTDLSPREMRRLIDEMIIEIAQIREC